MKSNNKYKHVFKHFELVELKQPVNDNYIQQPTLPFNFANDNHSKDGGNKS